MGVYDKKMKAQCKSFFKACTFFGAINWHLPVAFATRHMLHTERSLSH
jgi:hypothetical protein